MLRDGRFTAGALLAAHARNRGRQPAVIGPRHAWTWEDLHREVVLLTERLVSRGIGPGCRVGIHGFNGPSWLVAATAVAAAGGVLVPLNVRWAAHEQEEWLERSGALGVLDCSDDDREVSSVWRSLPAGNAAADLARVSELLTLMATSGSTGKPRGIGLTAGNHAAHALAHAGETGLSAEDRVLVVLPLFHIGGLNAWWRALGSGCTTILLPRFAVSAVAAAFRDHAPTMASMTGTMLKDLVAADVRPGPAMRYLLAGGEALAEELGAALPMVRASYGMTETCGHVAFGNPGGRGKDGLRVQPGTKVAVRDAEGLVAAAGVPGRIHVSGPTTCAGWLDPEGCWQPREHGAWLETEDLGTLTETGRLVILPRPAERIVSGGENISPFEIEAVLESLPELAGALVAGVPDARWGMRPAALVVAAAGVPEAVVRQAIADALQARLGSFKHPGAIHLVDSLPVLASGKRDRHAGARMLADRTRTD